MFFSGSQESWAGPMFCQRTTNLRDPLADIFEARSLSTIYSQPFTSTSLTLDLEDAVVVCCVSKSGGSKDFVGARLRSGATLLLWHGPRWKSLRLQPGAPHRLLGMIFASEASEDSVKAARRGVSRRGRHLQSRVAVSAVTAL